MTKRDLVSAALKVFGVILIVNTIIGSLSLVGTYMAIWGGSTATKESPAGTVAAWACYIVVSLIIGIGLVRDGDRIAALTIRADAPIPALDVASNARTLLSLALVVTGVVFVVLSITDLLGGLARFLLDALYTARAQEASTSDILQASHLTYGGSSGPSSAPL
jgi:hypothetical protein